MISDKQRREYVKHLRGQASARRNMMPGIRMSDRRLTDSIHMAFGLDDVDTPVHEALSMLADMVDHPWRGVCEIDGFITGSSEAVCERYRAKQADGGDARTGIEYPNCGGRIDFHAGHIPNGRVFVCEKGKPLLREVKYRCGNCDSTFILLEKCEPEVTGR